MALSQWSLERKGTHSRTKNQESFFITIFDGGNRQAAL
jgi:hypothetical protein